ncbi:MAG: hypothetical protein HZY76_12270 [Anaerolineae bacterium]|nr:MAG: hypothetical protein HZY76_12270 [Anaerolineae bacterium]
MEPWLGKPAAGRPQTRLVPVLLDAATGQPRPLAGEMPPYQAITQLFFSPDGSLFFVNGSTFTSEAGSNRVVRVWDTATGTWYSLR